MRGLPVYSQPISGQLILANQTNSKVYNRYPAKKKHIALWSTLSLKRVSFLPPRVEAESHVSASSPLHVSIKMRCQFIKIKYVFALICSHEMRKRNKDLFSLLALKLQRFYAPQV